MNVEDLSTVALPRARTLQGKRMRKRFLPALMVGALVLVLGLPTAAWAESGRQTFVLFDVDGETRVAAAGPIRGLGTDVILNETSDEETGTFVSEDKLVFPDGEVFVTFTGTAEFSFDERTCIGRGGGTASFEITGGTGRYEGASGSGEGTFRFFFIAARNPDGSCSQEEDVAGTFFARLSGTATVPDSPAAAA